MYLCTLCLFPTTCPVALHTENVGAQSVQTAGKRDSPILSMERGQGGLCPFDEALIPNPKNPCSHDTICLAL